MTGLLIKCPHCGKALKIRTSERPSDHLTKAVVYCWECEIKAEVFAEVINLQQGKFKPIQNKKKKACAKV